MADDAYRWPPLETLHSSLIGISIAFMGFAPRLMPVLLSLTATFTVIEALRAGRRPGELLLAVINPLAMRVALAFLLFGGLSAFWASEASLALLSVTQVAILVLATGVLVALLPPHIARLPPPRRTRFVRAVPLGFATAALFLLVEIATGHAISLWVVTHLPGLVGDVGKDALRQGNRIVGFQPFYLDRNAAALALLVPGALFATRLWLRPDAARWTMLAIVLAGVIVAALSWSGAAKLAATLGALVALAVAWKPALTQRALLALIVLGVLLALPLGHLPSRMGLETAGWLPPSARERSMIWDRTATAVRNTPIAGIGVQSTRFQDQGKTVRLEGVVGERRPLGWHAHNIVLQSWLELGVIGALLLMTLGLSLVQAAAALQAAHRIAAISLLTMVAAIGVTGWGMWQPWLVAIVGMATASLWVAPPAKP